MIQQEILMKADLVVLLPTLFDEKFQSVYTYSSSFNNTRSIQLILQ